MKTSVTIVLGILDIILYPDQPHIILLQKAVCQSVNILDKGTDHTDPCHICQTLFYCTHLKGQLFSIKLVHDALHGLQPSLDRFYWIMLLLQGKLLVQHTEFCFHLKQRTAVIGHKLL